MTHPAHLRRLNKLEDQAHRHNEETNAQRYDWRQFAALPREELLRLHAEQVDRPRTPAEEVEWARLRQLPTDELLRMHQEMHQSASR